MASQDTIKSDYIVNPYTGRLIKKGSKTHKKLVAAQLLDEPISTPQENVILEADDSEQAKVLQNKLNKSAHKNKVITRRGNKILKANRRPTRKETIDKVSDYAIDTFIENKETLLSQDMTDDETDNYIRNLIMLKLSGCDTTKTQQQPSPKKITTKKLKYELDDEFE